MDGVNVSVFAQEESRSLAHLLTRPASPASPLSPARTADRWSGERRVVIELVLRLVRPAGCQSSARREPSGRTRSRGGTKMIILDSKWKLETRLERDPI